MPTHGINLVEGSPLWLSSADAGSRSEGPCEEARRVVEWWVLAHRTGAWRGQGRWTCWHGRRRRAFSYVLFVYVCMCMCAQHLEFGVIQRTLIFATWGASRGHRGAAANYAAAAAAEQQQQQRSSSSSPPAGCRRHRYRVRQPRLHVTRRLGWRIGCPRRARPLAQQQILSRCASRRTVAQPTTPRCERRGARTTSCSRMVTVHPLSRRWRHTSLFGRRATSTRSPSAWRRTSRFALCA